MQAVGPNSEVTSTSDEPHRGQTTARRTADASVRSARGALLPSADASYSTRYQQGGQQVFNGLSFSNSSDAIQSSYGLNLNYRVNSATFVQPAAAQAQRDAVEADITGSAEQLRATVTQQYLTVLQAQARSALQDTLRRWREWSEHFERGRPRFDVRLRVRRVGLRYLRSLVHPDGRALLDAEREGDAEEVVDITLPFENVEYAYRELLTFGGDVEVLEPPELRERLVRAAQEVVALYA